MFRIEIDRDGGFFYEEIHQEVSLEAAQQWVADNDVLGAQWCIFAPDGSRFDRYPDGWRRA